MFILSSVSSRLEFLLVNHTSIDENFKNFKIMIFLGEVSNNWLKDLLGIKCIHYSWILLIIIIDIIAMY